VKPSRSAPRTASQRRRLASGLVAALIALGVAAPAAAADDAAQLALGKKLFTGGASPACAICHTLKDAGTEGAIGPVLDELKPDANRVAAALRNGLGSMPSYRASLSDEQIAALARYVSVAAGAAK
jgi:cytochrome c6